MKHRLAIATAAALVAAFSFAPALAADVGVSVNIGQPGFYGRVDIGNTYPQPVVVYPQPVIIAPTRVAVVQRPIYLHVPPGHARDWGKHCRQYNACGQPVYFVRDDWYREQYVPRYRSEHEHDRDRDRDRDRDDDDDRGDHGHGHGHGKGKGH